MKKLITFLGASRLEEVRYQWGEKSHDTCYASVASYVFLQPDEVLIFLTPEAKEKHLAGFSAELGAAGYSRNSPTVIDISLGKNEEELWELFGKISSQVDEKDEIVFDVTNAFRSLPLVGILVAAYLRTARQVNVSRVLYGAFEVKDASTTPPTAPMFDLSPMLDLLAWSAAVDGFNRTGNITNLADLLNTKLPGNALAAHLSKISQALHLLRPAEAMAHAATLPSVITRTEDELTGAASAHPFRLLLDKVLGTYQPIGLHDPFTANTLLESLAVERQLIQWYAARGQWMQAAALAREWVVDYVMTYRNDLNFNAFKEHRERAEEKLNTVSRKIENDEDMGNDPLKDMPNLRELAQIWGADKFSDIRNDIAHAGKREDPRSPDELIKQIEEAIRLLDSIDLKLLEKSLAAANDSP